MNIQSLSIVVPCGDYCYNNCRFCVSQMHHENYGAQIISSTNIPESYMQRVQWCRDEGCNSLILTGTTEPQQNLSFIYNFLDCNSVLRTPFYNISIQTAGTNLHPTEIEKMASRGINTFALSLSSFDDEHNWDVIQTPKQLRTMTTSQLIKAAQNAGMNVRICLNLTTEIKYHSIEEVFAWANHYNIDQLTFRKIYTSEKNTNKDIWIQTHKFSDEDFKDIITYVKHIGKPVRRLPFGAMQYDVNGISTVIDDDCMAQRNIEEMRYAILRPNNHLYSSWNLRGSLIF